MSVHLIGGGRDQERGAAVLAPFIAEATDAAAPGIPTIALLLVLEADDETSVDRFRSLLIAAGAPVVRVEAIVEGERFAASAVADVHGIFVGGGLTPAYHDAIMGIASEVRSAVARRVPYAGFSAGAAVAASDALVGGYLLNGVVVSPEDAAEELDELEVRGGSAWCRGVWRCMPPSGGRCRGWLRRCREVSPSVAWRSTSTAHASSGRTARTPCSAPGRRGRSSGMLPAHASRSCRAPPACQHRCRRRRSALAGCPPRWSGSRRVTGWDA